MKMEAYTQTIKKAEFVNELKKHQKMDSFVRGNYWNEADQKGCAVGCSLKSIATIKDIKIKQFNNHAEYETHLGIPEWLARVEDTLFEGMSLDKSKTWPVDFAKAINTGADLDKVKVPFICIILEHSLVSISKARYDAVKYPQVKDAIDQTAKAVKQMIKAQKSGAEKEIQAAAYSADSAAYSAYSAAYSAARSAADSADSADSAAYSAAYSAADSADSAAYSAAYSARSAAYSAAYSADSAAYSAAYSAADSAAYDYFADSLLMILKDCE
jgi:hypothetical protein